VKRSGRGRPKRRPGRVVGDKAALDMISFTYMRSEADRVLRTLQLSLSCSSP
jgi:hypothetical protein